MRLTLLTALFVSVAAPALAQEAATPPATRSMMSSPMGLYSMTRDASGTSWQPEEGEVNQPMHHSMAGPWVIMKHATLNLVYDGQGGPRGASETFVGGMVMLGAWRPVGEGALNLRAMLSPEPTMGAKGYPLLLAAGETANGVTELVDRQHPHDLFMELSASYSHPVAPGQDAFLYVGVPGEPAFGPPAFMHRQASEDSPAAPISHHWLDSTHVTFGVVTAGYVVGRWKVEASSFRGREPDQNRNDIETPKLDSWSTRLSWNPTRRWAAQISYADLKSPEQLEPLVDQKRTTASVLYGDGTWAATLAWGGKSATGGPHTNAYLGELAWTPDDHWTVFARAERTGQNELDPSHALYQVGEATLGAIYDIQVGPKVKIGLGGLVTASQIPAGLAASYGGQPTSGMAFLRLKMR
jgi:hypothetical protein